MDRKARTIDKFTPDNKLSGRKTVSCCGNPRREINVTFVILFASRFCGLCYRYFNSMLKRGCFGKLPHKRTRLRFTGFVDPTKDLVVVAIQLVGS